MFYIQLKTGREIETVDEFETRKEARAMLREYQMLSGEYYISSRACKEWRASKPAEEKPRYFVEFTDTYGGEANYSWVHRFIVTASSPRGAIRKVAKKTGFSNQLRKVADYGDLTRHNVDRACLCFFTQYADPEEVDRLMNNYSRIEVL